MPARHFSVPLARPQTTTPEGVDAIWKAVEAGDFEGPEAAYGNNGTPARAYDSRSTVFVGRDSTINFRNGHAFDNRRQVLYETNVPFGKLPVSTQRLQHLDVSHSNVTYLSNTWATNFYHWHCLTLPLLRFYESAGVEIDNVYVGDKLSSWQERGLELAGISKDRVVTGPCRAEVANVAVSTRRGGAVPPEQIEWVRSALVADEPKPGDKRLFVGRGETTTRRMIDEELVAAALEKEFGFEYIITSAMTLDEEIELFGSASSIVAPYGAALTNVLFAPRGTKVLELQAFDADFPATTAYLELSLVLGNPHALLRGEPTQRANNEIATDIKVSLDVVLRHVERMLAAE